MKISIITPSYNQGKFIDDAIRSVLDQNYPDFEHIIIDGLSTDDTIERLKRYSHLKWISEKDEGQSNALNKGFRMASGDIIGWLNADDFYLPGAFNAAAKVLSSEKFDGVYADIKFCDEKANIIGSKRSHRPVKFLSLFFTYIPSESFFFRRSIIDNQITLKKDMHICMDKEFMANILYNNYSLKYIRKYLSVFRWHDSNKSLSNKITKAIRLKEGIDVFNSYNGLIKINSQRRVNQFCYSLSKIYAETILPVSQNDFLIINI